MRFYGIPFSPYQLAPALVPYFPRRRPVNLVDVGASLGSFTEAVEAHAGIRHAILIEPQPENCRSLRTRFSEARFSVEECAVADVEGVSEMDLLNFHYASSLLEANPEFASAFNEHLRVRERIRVPVTTLDRLLSHDSWAGPIDLLKIDVQGAELKVLNGGTASLARTRLVWVEVSFRPLYKGSATFPEVYNFMRQHDFSLIAMQEGYKGHSGELLQADALFASASGHAR